MAGVLRLRDGWLRRQAESAARTVAAWPQWKRDAFRAALAPATPDPCPCPDRCDEAQTCIGRCRAALQPEKADDR